MLRLCSEGSLNPCVTHRPTVMRLPRIWTSNSRNGSTMSVNCIWPVSTQTTANDKLIANEIETTTTQMSIDYQKKTVDMAQDATTKLEHQMNVATDAYNDASDNFPTG